jgi:uncharacterized protein (TIGR03067 family)
MRSSLHSWASLALLLGLLVTASAQDTKEPDKTDKKDAKKKAGAAPLTPESLLAMLEKLGYEPSRWGKDKTNYQLAITTGDYKSTFSLYLSNDRTRLWIVASFTKLVDVEAVPATALLKLLAWNESIAPFHFILDEKAMRVYLQLSVPNEGIDSASLNVWIESMAGHIKRTAADWNYPVLQPPRPVLDGPEAKEERKKFLGTWTIHSFEQDGTTKAADLFKGYTYRFEGTGCEHGRAAKKKFLPAIDPRKTPGEIDFRIDLGHAELGIYKIEDDTLTLCIDSTGKIRPTKFEAPKGSTIYIVTLKRQKP